MAGTGREGAGGWLPVTLEEVAIAGVAPERGSGHIAASRYSTTSLALDVLAQHLIMTFPAEVAGLSCPVIRLDIFSHWQSGSGNGKIHGHDGTGAPARALACWH